LFQAGNIFADETTGLTAHLPALFTQHGIQNVQVKAHAVTLRAGTPEGQLYAKDMQYLFQTGRPFLQRRGHLPKDYDALCQQAISEMQQDDFCGTWNLLTIWGNKPKEKRG
jgi:hypothetical protein